MYRNVTSRIQRLSATSYDSIRIAPKRTISSKAKSNSEESTRAKAVQDFQTNQRYLRAVDDLLLATAKRDIVKLSEYVQGKVAPLVKDSLYDAENIQLDPQIPPYQVKRSEYQSMMQLITKVVDRANNVEAHLSDLEVEEYPADMQAGKPSRWLEEIGKMSRKEQEDKLEQLRLDELAKRVNLLKKIRHMKDDIGESQRERTRTHASVRVTAQEVFGSAKSDDLVKKTITAENDSSARESVKQEARPSRTMSLLERQAALEELQSIATGG